MLGFCFLKIKQNELFFDKKQQGNYQKFETKNLQWLRL
jgi:hypothetical protein